MNQISELDLQNLRHRSADLTPPIVKWRSMQVRLQMPR